MTGVGCRAVIADPVGVVRSRAQATELDVFSVLRTKLRKANIRNVSHTRTYFWLACYEKLIDCYTLLIRVVAKNTESKLEVIIYAL
jgi:hypothetical protein